MTAPIFWYWHWLIWFSPLISIPMRLDAEEWQRWLMNILERQVYRLISFYQNWLVFRGKELQLVHIHLTYPSNQANIELSHSIEVQSRIPIINQPAFPIKPQYRFQFAVRFQYPICFTPFSCVSRHSPINESISVRAHPNQLLLWPISWINDSYRWPPHTQARFSKDPSVVPLILK
jgi:hypothetical protein